MDERELTTAQLDALTELKSGFERTLARTPDPSSGPPPRRRRALAVATAGFAACVLIAFAVTSPFSSLDVDEAIASIADVAGQTEAPAPDAFVYSKSRTTATQSAVGDNFERAGFADGDMFEVRVESESWLSMTRTGLVRSSVDSPVEPKSPLLSVFEPTPQRQYRFAGRDFSYAAVERFAEDPVPLIQLITNAAARSTPEADRTLTHWRYLYEPLLTSAPPLPSSIRAALIGDLETIPGVKLNEDATDSKNRAGHELSIVSHGVRSALLFDPKNATLLETTTTVDQAGAGPYIGSKKGDLIERTTALEQRVVRSRPKISR